MYTRFPVEPEPCINRIYGTCGACGREGSALRVTAYIMVCGDENSTRPSSALKTLSVAGLGVWVELLEQMLS